MSSLTNAYRISKRNIKVSGFTKNITRKTITNNKRKLFVNNVIKDDSNSTLSTNNKKILKNTKLEFVKSNYNYTINPKEEILNFTLLFTRLSVGIFMFHHGQEKFISPDLFTKYVFDQYFTFLPEPRIFFTFLIAYIQIFSPILISLGFLSRIACASLGSTMLGAVFYHLISTGPEGFPFTTLKKIPIFHNYIYETPALYFIILFFLFIYGPGKFSISDKLNIFDTDEDQFNLKR